MAESKEIILTAKMAKEAKDRGISYGEIAAERFLIEHSLKFEPEEFEREDRFEFYNSLCRTFSKIVYKGN